jgi:hypothetical protein
MPIADPNKRVGHWYAGWSQQLVMESRMDARRCASMSNWRQLVCE